jgi:predicted DNA-binding transcriptional regulator AlpA
MCIKPQKLNIEKLKTLSTGEAAELISFKPQTLRKWAMDGSGPIQPIKIGNRLRWRLADIEELCKK